MGKFTGWDINAEPAKTCNNCGMTKENKKGCCNDKQETIQLKKVCFYYFLFICAE
jgi:hypothetical protein